MNVKEKIESINDQIDSDLAKMGFRCLDILQCLKCGYMTSQIEQMIEHCNRCEGLK